MLVYTTFFFIAKFQHKWNINASLGNLSHEKYLFKNFALLCKNLYDTIMFSNPKKFFCATYNGLNLKREGTETTEKYFSVYYTVINLLIAD